MSDCCRSWADINQQLSTTIVSRTSTIDVIQKLLSGNYALPPLMLFGWKQHPNPTTCRLFDPSDQKLYTIEHDLTKKIFTRQERRGIYSMRICGYKNGWVIFQTYRNRGRYGRDIRVSVDFVIYHMHSRLFFRLPELLRTSRDWPTTTGTATSLSSTPTSSDCVFLSLHVFSPRRSKSSFGPGARISNDLKITISSCLTSDQTWNETVVDDTITNGYTRGLVYLDGTFYCLFLCGEFRSFHVATRKWLKLPSIGCEGYLLVFNGKLLCAYLTCDRKYAVARFHFLGNSWVEYSSGLVWFVADHSSFCIPAIGKAKEMANSINVYDDGDGNHYSYRVGIDQVRDRGRDECYKPRVGQHAAFYEKMRSQREVHPRRLHVYSSLCDELELEPLQPIWIPPMLLSAVKEDDNRAIELKDGSSMGGREIEHAMHRAFLEQQLAKGMQVADSNDATKAKDDGSVLTIWKEKQSSNLPVSKANDGDSDVIIRKEKQSSNLLGSGESPEPRKPTKVSIDLIDKESSSRKQRVARTVKFGGLLNDAMAETVHLRAREVGTVCSVTYPLSSEELKQNGLLQDGCKLEASAVLYASVKGGMVWAQQLVGEYFDKEVHLLREDLEDNCDAKPGQTQQSSEDLMSSSSKDSVPSHMEDAVLHKRNNEPIAVETENLSGDPAIKNLKTVNS